MASVTSAIVWRTSGISQGFKKSPGDLGGYFKVSREFQGF